MTTSNGSQGDASNAPAVRTRGALAEVDRYEAEAAEAIEHVQDVNEAEQLLTRVKMAEEVVRLAKVAGDRERRWGALRLRAERRHGELLPPPKQAGPGRGLKKGSQAANVSSKDARSYARKVANVPEEEFNEYLDKADKPSRGGLLRATAKPPRKRAPSTTGRPKRRNEKTVAEGEAGIAYSKEAINWVRRRIRLGWSRDRIVSTATAGEDGWPHADKLSNGMFTTVRAIIYWQERMPVPGKRPKRTGKRFREVAATRRTPGYPSLVDLQHRVLQLTGALETTDLDDYNITSTNEHVVEEFYDDLIDLQFWMDDSLRRVEDRLGERKLREQIRKLREDHAGRTPEEIQIALRLADRREATLNRKLLEE